MPLNADSPKWHARWDWQGRNAIAADRTDIHPFSVSTSRWKSAMWMSRCCCPFLARRTSSNVMRSSAQVPASMARGRMPELGCPPSRAPQCSRRRLPACGIGWSAILRAISRAFSSICSTLLTRLPFAPPAPFPSPFARLGWGHCAARWPF